MDLYSKEDFLWASKVIQERIQEIEAEAARYKALQPTCDHQYKFYETDSYDQKEVWRCVGCRKFVETRMGTKEALEKK